MSPVPCTACGTVLVQHCKATTGDQPHPTCAWLRCPNGDCEWRTYDLDHGTRLNLDGTLERIAG